MFTLRAKLRSCLLVYLILAGGCTGSLSKSTVPAQHVQVEVGGEIEGIQGCGPWPRSDAFEDGLLSSRGIDTPCVCTVRLPDGQVFSTTSRKVIIGQKRHRVKDVMLLPPTLSLSYRDVVDSLSPLVQQLRFDDDIKLQQTIAEWRERPIPPEFGESTTATVGHRTSLFVEIKQIEDGPWFSVMTFTLLDN
jgi:hypothetical protein